MSSLQFAPAFSMIWTLLPSLYYLICLYLVLFYASTFEQNNDSQIISFENRLLRHFRKCKDHSILIEMGWNSCAVNLLSLHPQTKNPIKQASKHLIQSKIQTKRHRSWGWERVESHKGNFPQELGLSRSSLQQQKISSINANKNDKASKRTR